MTSTTPFTEPDDVETLTVDTVTGPDVARVSLHGEADLSNLPDLDGALAHMDLNGARCVQLDVTRLAFADVATVRRLALFARQARQSGHDITTFGANHVVRKVAGLMGADDDLGLT